MIAPEPKGSFKWTELASGPTLVCEALEPFALHLFTTRGWTLGSRAEQAPNKGWAEVAAALGVPDGCLIRSHQVHGSAVLVARERTSGRVDADVVITSERQLAVGIQTADCVPILAVDRRTSAVGAAHAGWRGLAARVPRALVEGMVRELGSRPSDLIVAAGPSIGSCCYEVGEDVKACFECERFSAAELARWFLQTPVHTAANWSLPTIERSGRPGHWFFDSWSAVRDQCAAAGVNDENIHLASLCTASHPAAFCSYRRDGDHAGRMAAGIRRRAVSERKFALRVHSVSET